MVAGDDDHAPLRHQRRKGRFEELQLAARPAVGQIAGGDHLIRSRLQQRGAELRGVGVVLLALARGEGWKCARIGAASFMPPG